MVPHFCAERSPESQMDGIFEDVPLNLIEDLSHVSEGIQNSSSIGRAFSWSMVPYMYHL